LRDPLLSAAHARTWLGIGSGDARSAASRAFDDNPRMPGS